MDMLFIVIGLQFIYIIYSDIQNRKERELLQLKLMSKDINEYKSAVEDTNVDSKKEEDPYLSMDEVGIEELLKTKEI